MTPNQQRQANRERAAQELGLILKGGNMPFVKAADGRLVPAAGRRLAKYEARVAELNQDVVDAPKAPRPPKPVRESHHRDDWWDNGYPRVTAALKARVDGLLNREDARFAMVAGEAAIMDRQGDSLPRDEWLILAAKALRSNALHGGQIARTLRTHGGLELRDVQTAIGAYIRHHETDYDSLYDDPGMFKELARDAIRTQLRAVPKPF